MKKIKTKELNDTIENFLPYDNMFQVNSDMINEILSTELNSINKGQFYVASLLDKLDKYNQLYLKDLDELLDKIVDSLDNLNFEDLNKLITKSTRLGSELYNNFLISINNIY